MQGHGLLKLFSINYFPHFELFTLLFCAEMSLFSMAISMYELKIFVVLYFENFMSNASISVLPFLVFLQTVPPLQNS